MALIFLRQPNICKAGNGCRACGHLTIMLCALAGQKAACSKKGYVDPTACSLDEHGKSLRASLSRARSAM